MHAASPKVTEVLPIFNPTLRFVSYVLQLIRKHVSSNSFNYFHV